MVSERYFINRHRVLSWLMWLLLPIIALTAAAPSMALIIETGNAQNKATNAPALLRIGNRDVVKFYATIGSVTPADRVHAAEEQVAQLPDKGLNSPISVHETKMGEETGLAVYVGPTKLFGLLKADIDPLSDYSLQDAAALAANNLSIALQALQRQGKPEIMLRGAALSLPAIALFALATWLIMRLRIRVNRALQVTTRRGLAKFILRGATTAAPLTIFLEGITAFASWLAVLFAAYVCVSFVLRSFPYTAPWGAALAGNLMRLFEGFGQSAVASIPDILMVAVIFIIARMATRLVSAFLRAVEEDRISAPFLYPDTALATRWLLLAAIWLFALAVAYPHIPGSNSGAFQGISLIAGLMVSLGSAGIVNQAMNGLVLVYSRALVRGDVVMIGDEKGVVTGIGLLSIKIKTCKSEVITIPNTSVVSKQIKNYSRAARGKGAAISARVSVGYDASWRQVAAMLELAAKNTSGIRQDVAPYVMQRELAEFYVNYDLVAYTAHPELYEQILSELHGNIQDIFNEHEVQIMSPNFQTQPDKKVLVPKERWFTPPASVDRHSEKRF
jgi:small-conductance mechanosensitive channel